MGNYIASQERTQSEILDEMRRIALAREFDQKKKLQMCIDALCKLDTLDNFAKGLWPHLQRMKMTQRYLWVFLRNLFVEGIRLNLCREFISYWRRSMIMILWKKRIC